MQAEKEKLILGKENLTKGIPYDLNWIKTFLMFFTSIALVAFLLIITCSIGFASISKENNDLLKNFCALMGIVIFLQILTASAGVLLHNPAKDWVGLKMKQTIVYEYSKKDAQINEAVQMMQSQLKCCGSLKYSDYKESFFTENRRNNPVESKINLQDTNTEIYAVPDSCCIAYSENCGRLVHPSNIYYQGCLNTIFGKLQSHLFMIFVVLFSLLIVEVLAMILGLMFIRSSQEMMKSR